MATICNAAVLESTSETDRPRQIKAKRGIRKSYKLCRRHSYITMHITYECCTRHFGDFTVTIAFANHWNWYAKPTARWLFWNLLPHVIISLRKRGACHGIRELATLIYCILQVEIN